jgi:excisionase family DNA binding protein
LAKETPFSEDLISLAQAAEYANLNAEFLRQLAVDGRLKAIKIGRNWVTTRSAVDTYLSNRKRRGRKPK